MATKKQPKKKKVIKARVSKKTAPAQTFRMMPLRISEDLKKELATVAFHLEISQTQIVLQAIRVHLQYLYKHEPELIRSLKNGNTKNYPKGYAKIRSESASEESTSEAQSISE